MTTTVIRFHDEPTDSREVQGPRWLCAVLRAEDAALASKKRLRMGLHNAHVPGVGGGTGAHQAG